MIRREERWPHKSHLHRFPQGCPGEACFWGSFLFSLVPTIDPAANVWWVLAAGPWDPGLWQLSATLPTLQPLLQLCFCAAHIKNCLPIHPSVHISIPLWLGDFGCFSHPQSTMLWHISTWTDTFPTFSSGTCRSLKSQRSRDIEVRTGWEGLQGAQDRHTLQGSSENPRCQPRGTGHCPILLLAFLLYPFSCSFFFYYCL